MTDKLNTAQRNDLPDSDFGIPSLREFPMPDAAHVRAAEAYFRYAPQEYKTELAQAIARKATQLGVTIKSPTVLALLDQ